MARRRVIAIAANEVILQGRFTPFSFGARRVWATLVNSPAGKHAEVHFRESPSMDVDAWVDWVLSVEPDIVGFAAYVWSFSLFLRVAERVRALRPACTIVFGGPSARSQMFDLPQFRAHAGLLDALVLNEGEWTFAALAALPSLDAASLATVPGLALHARGAWHETAEPPKRALDDLPSPTQLGMIPAGRTGAIETYRGCPMSCSFCQWGKSDVPDRVFSAAYVAADFRALAELGAPNVHLADAGLNLNSRGFRSLAEAERETGFLRTRRLHAAVYPTQLKDEHMTFLASIERPQLDIGIQSFNPEALASAGRAFRESRFARMVETLGEIAEVETELILGLPGDSPASFRVSFERALELGCRLRVFHCLVLPDALMVRDVEQNAIDFDPVTLMVRSCRGWTAEDLLRTREYVAEVARQRGGDVLENLWTMPPTRRDDRNRARGDVSPAGIELGAEMLERVQRMVGQATHGAWTVRSVRHDHARLLLEVEVRGQPLGIEAAVSSVTPQAFRRVRGIAFSYTRRGGAPDAETLRELVAVTDPLVEPARDVLGAGERVKLPVAP
ncbi:B12-binding domain-containing radical SAM protein [Polyangium mundeleinium]|uniref:B12-binding domain-containing radical SAM protein n=1 Tax=Polyangium mundeleinium TaxID=2995306 RepID=A0ABT5EQA0_9BACT|nr:B12-binding domain-containing radical SAM protein [Polyangium mundeleinium]MDC0743931.1 B12-binding domain-containing radical SAM protein [Polyangium mundeleinium]